MKFLFCGGGTLGPVTPLIAVMKEISARRPGSEFVFVGTPEGPERILIEESGFSFVPLASPKLRRYFSLSNLALPFELAGSLAEASGIIGREKPDVVVGAGGFTTVPIGIAAKLRGRKLLIHQQDVVPSLTNRILAPLADVVTVTFDKSLKDFPGRKARLTGNPVRPEFEKADRLRGLKFLDLTGERPVVLAVGGGTGSTFLNEIIALASPLYTDFADLVHITGLEKIPLRMPSLNHPERYRRREFIGTDIADCFAAADVVVTRAGMGTLTELAALSKPIVIVPIADSHQEVNASYVTDNGGARMFRELDLTPEHLVTFIRDLLRKPEQMAEMGSKLRAIFGEDARSKLAEEVLKLASGGR